MHFGKFFAPVVLTFLIGESVEGLTYKDLVVRLHPTVCTQRQYAAIIMGGKSPLDADCGKELQNHGVVLDEANQKLYPPRTIFVYDNCLVACTLFHNKVFHAETGVITNQGLLRTLLVTSFRKVWFLSYL